MTKTSTTKSKILAMIFVLAIMVSAIIPMQVSAVPSWPTLTQGSTSRNEVYALQYLINYWGYNTIDVDGSFGPGTDTAVRNFQSKKGLAVDGSVGPSTWTALTNVTQKTSSFSANATKAIQYLLKNKYGISSLAVDGSFGPATETAVRSFQSANSISVDGSVGPTTWQYLIGAGIAPPAATALSWPVVDANGNKAGTIGCLKGCTCGAHSATHNGVDIKGCADKNVIAMAAGSVISAYTSCTHSSKCTCNGGAGNSVTIRYDNGMVSQFFHLKANSVKVTSGSVAKGKVVAVVGTTGNSTGPHLHLNLFANVTDYNNRTNYLNPVLYI